MTNIKSDLSFAIRDNFKHLSGQHDQKTHGSWAEKKREAKKRREQEREWKLRESGFSPVNESKSLNLEESIAEIKNLYETDYRKLRSGWGYGINQDTSVIRDYLLNTTGAKKVWFGDALNGGKGLVLEDKQGTELLVQYYTNDGINFDIGGYWKKPSRGILGIRFMKALKQYVDMVNGSIEISKVANPQYFDRYDWLKTKNDGWTFFYRPWSREWQEIKKSS